MFKRKLQALGYIDYDKVDGNNLQHVKKLIPWLEDKIIRHYTIDDRKNLQNLNDPNWYQTFEKYALDLGCPNSFIHLDKVEWIIGLAVTLAFDDNCDRYKMVTKDKKTKNESAPSVKSTNPLDNLDFQSIEFKNGVNALAEILNIPKHQDHLITLEACSKLVCKRLNPDALKDPHSFIVKGKPFPIMETASGFQLNDKALDNAAKVLSLLYIQDLRNLQTQINEAIVAVQNVTANPKTDTRLGKVGR